MRRFKPGHAIEDAREFFYVERDVDRVLFERLLGRQFTFLLAPRQVGKTSLLKQTSARLVARGTRVVFVDLQGRGVSAGTPPDVAESRWYRSLADAIARPLGLGSQVKPFFDERPDRTPVAAWSDFVHDVVLASVAEPIVLLIDEVDRTLALPFARDDFFGAIRAMDNGRALDEAWRRWTVCLCGVAAPADLVVEPRNFPVVQPDGVVRLRDLTRPELDTLASGLAGAGGDEGKLLDAVYAWTSGHPAMTQKLCGALASGGSDSGTEAERVDRLVRRLYLDEGRQHDALLLDVEHRFPLGALSEDAVETLSMYQSARAAKPAIPFKSGDPVQLRLVIAALAAERDGELHVRNRIYEQAFDSEWVASRLEERPIARAYGAWADGGRAKALLLSGDDLVRAQGWAQGRNLTGGERAFLALSVQQQAAVKQAQAERERDQARRQARNRTMLAVGAVLVAIMFGGIAVYAFSQRTAAVSATKRVEELLGATRDVSARDLARNAILAARDPMLERETVADALRAAERSTVVLATPELAEAGFAAFRAAPLVGRLHGHTGAVLAATFSRDGSRVVSASADGTARIWDAQSGELLTTLAGHTAAVRRAAFSPDGTSVVTASDDRTARLWDTKSGELRTTLQGHDGVVWTAAFSPDGTRVVTASSDKTARLWDAKSGELLSTFRHGGEVWTAAFSPSGAYVATASADGTARLWDAKSGDSWNDASSGDLVTTFRHTRTVWICSFSPDGSRVLTASEDKTARLWDVKSGQLQFTLQGHTDAVRSAEFSPDGARVVTASGDGTARLWDSRSGQILTVLGDYDRPVRGAEFSPDGARVVTACEDRSVCLWDAKSGQLLTTLQGHDGEISSASFSPDGARVVTASEDKTVRLWDAKSIPLNITLRVHDPVPTARFSTDSTRVVTASAGKTAQIWDAESGQLLATLQGHQTPLWTADFSPDGSRVVTASQDTSARIWDAKNGQPLTTLQGHQAPLWTAEFSPDGTRVITASVDKTARLWDAQSGQLQSILQGHSGAVVAAEFSPDGTRVVTASGDGTARLWDARSAQLQSTLQGHTDAVTTAEFSPDSTRVVTASQDHTARVWDVQKGQLVTILRGHTAAVTAAAFSPDGARVVTASADSTSRLWDARSGQLVTTLVGHAAGVSAASFSPDGTRIVTASLDGTARLWPADYKSSVPWTCAIIRDSMRYLGPDYQDLDGICRSAPGPERIAVPYYGLLEVGGPCTRAEHVLTGVWNCDASRTKRVHCQNGMVTVAPCAHVCVQKGNGISDECQ